MTLPSTDDHAPIAFPECINKISELLHRSQLILVLGANTSGAPGQMEVFSDLKIVLSAELKKCIQEIASLANDALTVDDSKVGPVNILSDEHP